MPPSDFFPATGWATILGAQDDLATLERLLTRYRRPILLEIQSRRRCPELEAEELTQQFIHNCLRRDFLKNVDPGKGRFRSFIKRCIVNFLRDEHRKVSQDPAHVSLNETDGEGRRLVDPPADTAAPGELADVSWARQVLALSLQRLQEECVAARRGTLFGRLQGFLHTEPEGDSYAAVAGDLRMKEGAVRTAVHRLRQRLGEIIKEEIAQTVAGEGELQDELRYFLELLGRPSSVT